MVRQRQSDSPEDPASPTAGVAAESPLGMSLVFGLLSPLNEQSGTSSASGSCPSSRSTDASASSEHIATPSFLRLLLQRRLCASLSDAADVGDHAASKAPAAMQSRPCISLANTASSLSAQGQPATAMGSAALASWRHPGGRAPSQSILPAAATQHHRMPAVSSLRAKPRSAGLRCRTPAEAQQVRGLTAALHRGAGVSGARQWQLRAQRATAATCIARQHNNPASAPQSLALSALKCAYAVGPQ